MNLIKKNKNPNILTRREEREIIKENRKMMKHFEDRKKRKNVSESEYLTQMHDSKNVVEFDDLHTYFYTSAGTVKAVDGVTFDIPEGSTVGVVGESGCGKSVTSLSLMQLLQAPQGQITGGTIRYNSGSKCYDVAKMPTEAMRKIRGKEISMIFQEPMT
ncbi:MAG TPA: dipeptide/oligopeptide/nickel ABC transporter ATP-binding protein, partial [Clostridiales bacterium]|nr:dipeptide/oligopeptide/nickel ABC transporter ATP-binding protein [Clostridiales bacterium]